MRIGNMSCCGVKEMAGISFNRTSEAALQDFCKNRFTPIENGYGYNPEQCGNGRLQAAHFIFTQAGDGPRNHYGENLAAYIRENNLGPVMRSVPKRNPNSRRQLVAFVWTPDVRRLKTWWKRHPIPPTSAQVLGQVINGG